MAAINSAATTTRATNKAVADTNSDSLAMTTSRVGAVSRAVATELAQEEAGNLHHLNKAYE